MSEQPRPPASGPDPGQSRWEPGESAADPQDQARQSASPDQVRHPWQGGAPPSGTRGVPASQPQATGNGQVSGDDEQSRLGPRPVQRPSVDPHDSALFSRPQGVEGSFDPS